MAKRRQTEIGRRLADAVSGLLGQPKPTHLAAANRELERVILRSYQIGLQQPDQVARWLGEASGTSNTMMTLISNLNGINVGTDVERQRAVEEARRLFLRDVTAQFMIWLWTNYGFGEAISLTCEDEKAQVVWDDFMAADSNQPILGEGLQTNLSEQLLTDGELFLVFFISKVDGDATMRLLQTDEITEIRTHPEDDITPIWYKREFSKGDSISAQAQTVYYPAFDALVNKELDVIKFPSGTKKANDQLLPKWTEVCVYHIAHNRKNFQSLRGWPLTTVASPWVHEHTRFRENRATVSEAVAMFVREVKATEGGTRAVEYIRGQLASQKGTDEAYYNPDREPVGDSFVTNDAMKVREMSMGTGASDAKYDGEGLLQMVGLGGGIYPHWLGSGDAYRLATATSMEGPMYRLFSRYQTFWSAAVRKVLRIILVMKERHGGVKFSSYKAEVSSDRLVEMDSENITEAGSRIMDKVVLPGLENGLLNQREAALLARFLARTEVQSLGAEDAGMMVPQLPDNAETVPGVVEPEPVPNELQQDDDDVEEARAWSAVAEVLYQNAGQYDPEVLLHYALQEVSDADSDR